MAEAVAERCRNVPEIDFVQVWLADGTNNHCECENCVKMRPSDWYVTLLNDIDAKLTENNLDTKVVFLLYVDLLWEPQQVELKNPERFVLMFAPITRTYSASIADAGSFDEEKLPPYQRNRLQFPRSVEENLAWMRRWRRHFAGDGFDFDYHFMWDHWKDPGYYAIAQTLFKDMQSLHKVGLNGMVSCQNQRVFFPTGLGMTAMAEALWDEQADFEEVAQKYFRDAFGQDGEAVRSYMRQLTEAFDPVYIRGEKPWVNPENAAKLASVPEILEAHRPLIAKNAADQSLPKGVRASWGYLQYHSELCALTAEAFLKKAQGNFKEALEALEEVLRYARSHEKRLHRIFDVLLFQDTVTRALKEGMAAE
jgi:tetratricopeptide (TPR) repeat protein